MEFFLQQRLKPGGRGISRVKETVHLAASWTDLANWNERERERSALHLYGLLTYLSRGLGVGVIKYTVPSTSTNNSPNYTHSQKAGDSSTTLFHASLVTK